MRRDRMPAAVWLPLEVALAGCVCAKSGLLVEVTTMVGDFLLHFTLFCYKT